MSKRTVHKVQTVMRVLAVLGWIAFIGALLCCMAGCITRETGAWITGIGTILFTLGVIFGGCL